MRTQPIQSRTSGETGAPSRLICTLFLLFVLAWLLAATPASRAGAAWKTTDAGTMYTQSESPGYVTGLKKIGSYWYYFDKNGIMVTGWVKINKKLSYFNSKGRRVTGWLTYGKKKNKYYLDKNGIMQTGFVTIGTRIYYFNSKGVMQTGWITCKGKRYFASSSGALFVSRWVNNYYFQSDGSLAVNTWVDGKWVGSNGKYTVQTGWVTLGGKTYYYKSNGTKATGWLTLSGKTYYLSTSDGSLKKSTWICISKKYYYANSKGVIQKSTWVGKRYVDSSGVMATGFYKVGSSTYYFKPSSPNIGVKQTGWLSLNGKRYRLNSKGVLQVSKWLSSSRYYATGSGALAMGLYYIGSDLYYFNTKTGKKITSTMVTVNSATYYFRSTGKAAKSTWLKYNGKYYYFQSTGKMAKSMWVGSYYVDETGARTNKEYLSGWVTKSGSKYYYSNYEPVTGFQTISGSTYYFNASGVMQTGLQTISGKTYYFYSGGAMAVSVTLVIGNTQYVFGTDGAATETTSIDVSGDTLGTQIVNYALQFVGNPYVYGGTSLTNGADCSGFVQTVFAHFDIKLLRVANDQMYGPSSTEIKQGYAKAVSVDLSSIQPGDLLFYGYGSYATHVAIYIGDGKIVHASNSQPYPLGGIKISDYDYQTPLKAIRYWS